MTPLHRAIRRSINVVEYALFTALCLVFAALGCAVVGCIIWIGLRAMGVI